MLALVALVVITNTTEGGSRGEIRPVGASIPGNPYPFTTLPP